MMKQTLENMKGPVLLVEDNPDLLRPLEILLKEAQILTTALADSNLAIEQIRSGLDYRLAVIDASYPPSGSPTGRDIFYESKRVNPDVPVIVMTGYSIPMPWAIDGVLRKPFKGEEFVKLVESYLKIAAKP